MERIWTFTPIGRLMDEVAVQLADVTPEWCLTRVDIRTHPDGDVFLVHCDLTHRERSSIVHGGVSLTTHELLTINADCARYHLRDRARELVKKMKEYIGERKEP